MLKTAKDIFELLTEQNIEQKPGTITFNLMDISIIMGDKSAIGYIFQEWFGEWLKHNNIDFEVNENSQEFPDFYLLPKDHSKGLLELKTFDADAGANFDVANFEAYRRSLETKSYRLDADYLIFSYTMRDKVLMIKDFWIKKIWEITCPSELYSIKTQNKQDMIYNIRPSVWYSDRARFKSFKTKQEFVEALYKTIKKYPKTSDDADRWLDAVKKDYLVRYKKSLL